MRGLDFTTLQGFASALIGLSLFALVGIGVRILIMVTLQQRRERMNRQINERLKVLIAAYRTLGGSFSGNLTVDPRHLRELAEPEAVADDGTGSDSDNGLGRSSDRKRRIRDAVEAALADILLLGTEDQVRLAAAAASDLAAGRPVQVNALVVSLRDFIRKALDLDPVPEGATPPPQGPVRTSGGAGRGGREGGRAGGRGGGDGTGGGGVAMGGGLAMGLGGTDGGQTR